MTEAAIRQQIWATSKQSTEVVDKAKKGLSLQPGSMPYYEALLRRVEELMKPKRTKRVQADQTTQASRDRYRQAKWEYELNKFKPWVQDGHFIEPEYPNCATKKGLDEFICNFLKWNGHFQNPTNNRGLPVTDQKTGETVWRRSGSNKGMQDIDSTLNHPDHEFGIPWKIETKTENDYQSKPQEKFEKKVKATAGVYSLVHNAEDFLSQYDHLMIRKVKQKELF